MNTDSQYNYDKHIAEAATEYRACRINHNLERSEETQTALSFSYEKLYWMIDAKRYGWNPESYEPEDLI